VVKDVRLVKLKTLAKTGGVTRRKRASSKIERRISKTEKQRNNEMAFANINMAKTGKNKIAWFVTALDHGMAKRRRWRRQPPAAAALALAPGGISLAGGVAAAAAEQRWHILSAASTDGLAPSAASV
jgi:hypothetical protein